MRSYRNTLIYGSEPLRLVFPYGSCWHKIHDIHACAFAVHKKEPVISFGFLFWRLLWRHCKTSNITAEKPKFYSSSTEGPLSQPIKSKRPSSGIANGAFRSILLLSILMKNKQIFKGCWLFLTEQKYDVVPLHNSKLHRRTTVHNLTMIYNTWKL